MVTSGSRKKKKMASEKVVPKSCVISDVKMFTFHFCHTFLVLLEVTTQGTAAMSRNYRFLWVEHCRKYLT